MTKEELKGKKLYPILLGCDKNRVDLEKMLHLVKEYGIEITNDESIADIVLVQTCAFILPARQEAIQNILYAINLKQSNSDLKIIVSGCFPQKNLEELKQEFPEVDGFLTIANYPLIVNLIENIYAVKESKIKSSYTHGRVITTQPHFSYLKIADGCNNCCSYCTIPRIRGRYKSIPMPDLLKEANLLADNGVKEIILVAQDVTRYGEDIYSENKLIQLINELSKIKKIKWIRLLYCYPEKVTDDLLEVINNNEKVCKYIDMPLQHIDNSILKSMNRRVDETQTITLIEKIKNDYPNIKIRTTYILGYPGETKKAYKKLLDFNKKYKLDFVGFFSYSREENTKAYYLKNQVPNFIKKLRLNKAQKIQNQIFIENSQKYIGDTFDCIIDEFDEIQGVFIGRLDYFAPEIDFVVHINNDNLVIGDIYKVRITDFENFNFKGEII